MTCCAHILALASTKDLKIENLNYKHYGIEDGLSHREVNTLIQDKNGFLWIGTENGLNRYDGYNFKRYYLNNNNQSLNNSEKIIGLCDDIHGNILIANINGLYVLSVKDENIQSYYLNNNSTNTYQKRIEMLYKNKQAVVYVGLSDGSISIIDSNYKFKEILKINSKKNIDNRIADIKEDQYHALWISTVETGIVYQYDLKTKKLKSYNIHENILGTDINKNVVSIINDEVYVSIRQKGIVKYNRKTDQFDDYYLPVKSNIDINIHAQFIDSQNQLWYSLDENRLQKINLKNKVQTNYDDYLTKDYNLGRVNSIIEDQTGCIWVGNQFGLIQIIPNENYFKNNLNSFDPIKSNQLSFRQISSNKPDHLIAASYQGLVLLNTKTQETKIVNLNKSKREFKDRNIFPYSYYVDSNQNNFWIATEGEGLLQFNYSKNEIKWLTNPNPEIEHTIKYCTVTHKEGDNLYVGTYHGFYTYNLKSKSANPHVIPKTSTLYRSKIWLIQKYDTENLVIGSSFGIYLFNINTKKLGYLHELLKEVDARCFLKINKSKFWVGTNGKGAWLIEGNKKTIFNEINGLANNVVNSIIADKFKTVWVATNNGLTRINEQNFQKNNYYINDGLASNEFNQNSNYLADDGTIYLGTINGLVSFNPNKIPIFPTHHPKIILISYQKYDGEKEYSIMHSSSLDQLKNILVLKDDKYFTLQVALNDFRNLKYHRFAYQLEGFEKSWNYTDQNRIIRYNNLPAGKYTLVVKSSGTDSSWNTDVVKIPVYVEQAYFKSYWFAFHLLILISLLFYAFNRYRFNQYKKMDLLRNNIASDLHDEVGSWLTRIAIHSNLLQSDILNETETKDELNEINNASRMAISTMSNVLWSIDTRNDRLIDLCDKMKEHAYHLFDNSEINITFHTDGIDESTINIKPRQQIFLLYKEALHNIQKHASAKNLFIEFSKTNKLLKLIIKDDGVGFEEKNNRKGMGLRNMKMRAEQIGAVFQIEDNKGITIQLTLKL